MSIPRETAVREPERGVLRAKKYRALLVADRPNWVYHRKAHIFQKLAENFESEIGFVCPDDPAAHWQALLERNDYDIIWNLGFRMGHDEVHRDDLELGKFIKRQNAKGCAVVATVSNSLVHFPLPRRLASLPTNGFKPKVSLLERDLLRTSHAEDMSLGYLDRVGDDVLRLRMFNGVSVNNKFAYLRLIHAGVPCRHVPDGVNLNVFQCQTPLALRALGMLFVSSHKKQTHKGIGIFRAVSKRLAPLGVRCHEVIADSTQNKRTPEDMCRIYNEFPIFLCASRAEGGPATLLESAACGCVPVSTPVGYSAEVVGSSNGFIVPRDADAIFEKVVYLRDNPQVLEQMSERVRCAVESFDWTRRIVNYEQFLLDHLIQKPPRGRGVARD